MDPRARLGSLALVAAVLGCGQGPSRSSKPASTATAPVTSTTAPPVPAPSPAPRALAPTIASLSTATAPLDGGALVTITGTNYKAAGAGETFVLFGLRAVLVTPSSDTRIDVVVPAGAALGFADVRVTNALGTALLARAFSYTPRAASMIFSPVVGHHELGLTGTRITLALRDFAPVSTATRVTFGGKDAAAVAAPDSATLVAEVPDGLMAGLVEIVVEESGRLLRVPGFLVQGALAYGDITINEVCPAPSGADNNRDGGRSSGADEFVELVNTTARPVDLSYLTLYDSKTVERHRFPNPTTLPPGGAIVVFGGGTPEGFAPRHESGSAQAASSGELGLNNTADSIELRALPGIAPVGKTIFKLDYTNPPAASSLVNVNDGQAIRTNPATSADYTAHTTAPGAKGAVSPARRVDGSKF